MNRTPTCLRVVLTRSCPMRCPFCHAEGLVKRTERLEVGSRLNPAQKPLSVEDWQKMLEVALRSGVRKIKFLGGEPLVAPHLPQLIAYVKASEPEVDVSIVTSGAARLSRLQACFAAGLDRANLSIHGWTRTAVANRPQATFDRSVIQQEIERDAARGSLPRVIETWHPGNLA